MSSTPAARPTAPPPAQSERSPWPALWALVIGFFMILVDSTIVSIATPALLEHFDTGLGPVLWVTSAYPEATEHAGRWVGLLTVLGFAAAFLLSAAA